MKKLDILLISVLVTSTSALADNANDQQMTSNASMPPPMREAMRQQWMQQNLGRQMTMMRGQQNRMMMDPQMMHNMMRVHLDQMREMEEKIASIESLLSTLVELQKKR